MHAIEPVTVVEESGEEVWSEWDRLTESVTRTRDPRDAVWTTGEPPRVIVVEIPIERILRGKYGPIAVEDRHIVMLSLLERAGVPLLPDRSGVDTSKGVLTQFAEWQTPGVVRFEWRWKVVE